MCDTLSLSHCRVVCGCCLYLPSDADAHPRSLLLLLLPLLCSLMLLRELVSPKFLPVKILLRKDKLHGSRVFHGAAKLWPLHLI